VEHRSATPEFSYAGATTPGSICSDEKKVKFLEKDHQHLGVENRFILWKWSNLVFPVVSWFGFAGFGSGNLVDFGRFEC